MISTVDGISPASESQSDEQTVNMVPGEISIAHVKQENIKESSPCSNEANLEAPVSDYASDEARIKTETGVKTEIASGSVGVGSSVTDNSHISDRTTTPCDLEIKEENEEKETPKTPRKTPGCANRKIGSLLLPAEPPEQKTQTKSSHEHIDSASEPHIDSTKKESIDQSNSASGSKSTRTDMPVLDREDGSAHDELSVSPDDRRKIHNAFQNR